MPLLPYFFYYDPSLDSTSSGNFTTICRKVHQNVVEQVYHGIADFFLHSCAKTIEYLGAVFYYSIPLCPGVCKTDPADSPDTLQHPFTLQHALDATPVIVFYDKGIIIIQTFKLSAKIVHAGMPLIPFPSSIMIPWFHLIIRQVFYGEADYPSSLCHNGFEWVVSSKIYVICQK